MLILCLHFLLTHFDRCILLFHQSHYFLMLFDICQHFYQKCSYCMILHINCWNISYYVWWMVWLFVNINGFIAELSVRFVGFIVKLNRRSRKSIFLFISQVKESLHSVNILMIFWRFLIFWFSGPEADQCFMSEGVS